MNRAAEILDYLAKTDDSEVLIIAPMAPPVDKTSHGLRVALNRILDASDVADTLTALRSRSAAPDVPSSETSGAFSFGLKDVGRFRVNYMTQRGSKVVSIARVPVALASADAVCDDRALVEKILMVVRSRDGGALAVLGPSPIRNSHFVYSLMQHINRSERRIIFCIERALTFLVHHDNSIVLQSELSIDVPSMEDGIQGGLLFAPDIMYVGDVRSPSEMAGVAQAMQTGVFCIFSSSSLTAAALLRLLATARGGLFERVSHMVRGVVRVEAAPGGRLKIAYSEKIDEG